MDKEQQIIRALYGELPDHQDFRRLIEEDEEFRREYHALSEVKFFLDHRRRERPDDRTIEAVMRMAQIATTQGHTGYRDDRAPAPRSKALRYRLAGVFATLLLIIGLGVWQLSPLPVMQTEEEAPQITQATEQPSRAARTLADRQPQAPVGPSLSAETLISDSGRYGHASDVRLEGGALAWDEGETVRALHGRVRMLMERSDALDWGEPMFPSESMFESVRSEGNGRYGLQPAYQIGE